MRILQPPSAGRRRCGGIEPWCALIGCLTLAGGCGGAARTTPSTSPPTGAPPPSLHFEDVGAVDPAAVHTVRAGETLWSISRAYGVSLEDVVRANGITDPDLISAGERIRIPAAIAADSWVWPVAGGQVVSRFGSDRGRRSHKGLDIRAYRGQQVLAAWSGLVVYSASGMRDYGRTIILDHGGGLTSLYAHNSELLVGKGEWVGRGQAVALAGQTGNATAVHCHFEVRRNDVPFDPLWSSPGR